MTSRDFCFWLQGFLELSLEISPSMTPAQTAMMQKHLALVFKHEIDPSMPSAVLDAIHANDPKPTTSSTSFGGVDANGNVFRC